MITRIPKRKRAHKFKAATGRTGKFLFCEICSRMEHFRRHQPLWWRILHRDLYR